MALNMYAQEISCQYWCLLCVCVCVCAQAKPRWKKMWEKELKDIVSEQTIIKEQEGKIGDLDDTLQDLKELYEKLEQVW